MLQFNEGEKLMIVSGSVDNSYTLFGFQESVYKQGGSRIEQIEVKMIESTTVLPLFDTYAPGNR